LIVWISSWSNGISMPILFVIPAEAGIHRRNRHRPSPV
jgi:hypothetical protein